MARNRPPGHFGMGSRITVGGGLASTGTVGGNKPLDPKRAFTDAHACFEAGQLHQAEQILRALLAADPRHHGALHLLGMVAFQAGNPAAAIPVIQQAIGIEGSVAEYHSTLGSALLAAGKRPEGEAALRRGLELKPSHGRANYNLGLLCLQTGRADESRPLLQKAVAKLPGDIDVLNALGVALVQTGEHRKAVQTFSKVLKAMPGHDQARLNRANAWTELGLTDKSIPEYGTLLERHPRDPSLLFHQAAALSQAGRGLEAVGALEAALDGRPDYIDAHINLGNLLVRRGEFPEAIDHLKQARAARVDDPILAGNLAKAHLGNGDGIAAASIAREVLEHRPDDDGALEVLVRSLRNDGEFDEAAALIAGAREQRPDSTSVLLLQATQVGAEMDEASLATMAKVANDATRDVMERTLLHFALGDVYHRRGETDQAMRAYAAGNALRGADYSEDAKDSTEAFTALRQTFDSKLFERFSGIGSDSQRPVFIVGMPRSGTTLVEQILASHPDVAGGGELVTMAKIAEDLPKRLESVQPYPECLDALTDDAARDMSNDYLARLGEISDGARFVTDKMPNNFEHLGLIALLLPAARIIHCRRRPQATGLSIYFQNFKGRHAYAYDLYDIGRQYRNYQDLMEHWRGVLPLPMLEVDYEDLVGDQEGTSRKLLEFLDLSWTDRVLDFHQTERAVQTASLWQVRQPLYTSALEGWRRYESYMEPFERGLSGAAR